MKSGNSKPDLRKNGKLKWQRLSINLTGSRKGTSTIEVKQKLAINRFFVELLEVRAFWCKKLCYIWDEDTKMFTKLVGLDKGITNTEFHNLEGLDHVEQFLR